MKILLIRPPTSKHLFGAESFMPLGLAYIGAVLEKDGHQVKIIDLTTQFFTDDEIISFVKKENPEMVGFSAVTPTVNNVYKIAGLIKNNFKIITVIGGPHPSALPEEPLFHNIDFVVRGEGELTMVDLCRNLNNPSQVQGISYLDNNKVAHNPAREYIKDLDTLPFPARHLFPDLKLYKGQPALGNQLPVGNILTSRGCPYNCTFCFKAVFGNRFRARTAESIFLEWEELVNKYKVKEIAIVDDLFTTNIERVNKICDLIIKNKLKIPWCCPNGIRVDNVSYELLHKMREAGCYRVAFGVESGSQKILDSINKKITIEQIEKAFKIAREVKIETMAFIMLGHLEETRETMQETIDFSKRLNATYVQFLITVPYPGSCVYAELKKEGNIFINNWDEYGEYEGLLCFEHKNITKEMMREFYSKAYKSYYLRPGYLLKQVFNFKTYKFLPRRLKAFSHILK